MRIMKSILGEIAGSITGYTILLAYPLFPQLHALNKNAHSRCKFLLY